MSTVTLKKMTLLNFKGIKNLTINFDANTNIYGDNGTGKTTIVDAFTWLLFGKDSTDRKDFEIKTLDKYNEVIPKIDHEVYAELGVNGDIVTIKRTLRDKWVKQKGALEAEFTGNETLYYWNEVPLTMKEFGNKVSEILDEAVFKLITSPAAFNSLKWQDRRNVLIKVAGEISDAELAKGNKDYQDLLAQLTNKSLEEYKKQIAASIKKMKDDIKMIPTRIDEVERGKPESVDIEFIEAEINKNEALLSKIDKQLSDKSAAYDEILQNKKNNSDRIFSLTSQKNSINFQISEEAKRRLKTENSASSELRSKIHKKDSDDLIPAQQKLNRLKSEKETLIQNISSYETSIKDKRDLWHVENSKTFNFSEDNAFCPCCNRKFDENEVEEKKHSLQENFNQNKQKLLSEINNDGKTIAEKKKNAETELEEINSRITQGEKYIKQVDEEILSLKNELKELESQVENKPSLELVIEIMLKDHPDYYNLCSEIENLQKKTFDIPEDQQNQELLDKKKEINSQIQSLRDSLKDIELIAASDKRITELKNEESNLAQEIANIEKTQYTIDNFIKLQVETIEQRVNEKFSFVKFRLFEKQINGALVPCCDALINGVPYSDANTASKINAGIDIINTLCEFYNVSAPIFIDNRESVVKLHESNSQIINLFVSQGDKKLRIN